MDEILKRRNGPSNLFIGRLLRIYINICLLKAQSPDGVVFLHLADDVRYSYFDDFNASLHLEKFYRTKLSDDDFLFCVQFLKT